MTKIIHCADLHLDSPMETHMTEEQASTRNTEIIYSFLRLTEYAAKNDVRAVILAGDMFDGERVKVRTIDESLTPCGAHPMLIICILPATMMTQPTHLPITTYRPT